MLSLPVLVIRSTPRRHLSRPNQRPLELPDGVLALVLGGKGRRRTAHTLHTRPVEYVRDYDDQMGSSPVYRTAAGGSGCGARLDGASVSWLKCDPISCLRR